MLTELALQQNESALRVYFGVSWKSKYTWKTKKVEEISLFFIEYGFS